MTLYLMALLLFVMGLYCLIAKKHLIKKIIGFVILEYATNLFLILVGYREGGVHPILLENMEQSEFVQKSVDPLAQALVLTNIVIWLGVLFLLVTISLNLYAKYKTFDTSEINKLKG